jgi:hypothetical protein
MIAAPRLRATLDGGSEPEIRFPKGSTLLQLSTSSDPVPGRLETSVDYPGRAGRRAGAQPDPPAAGGERRQHGCGRRCGRISAGARAGGES